MIRNDTCTGSTPEKKEHSYINNVTEVTRLSMSIYGKTETLGNVFFGCKPKEPAKEEPVSLEGVVERQVEVLIAINIMLDEILARMIG